ncbi:MAG: hypothetical protein ACK5LP_07680 [Campylobacteraceae bacterium]
MEHIKRKIPIFVKALFFAFLSLIGYLFIGFIVAIFFTGCATKTESIVIEKTIEVEKPVKCGLSLPQRPVKTDSVIENFKGIATYADSVEVVAIECGAVIDE